MSKMQSKKQDPDSISGQFRNDTSDVESDENTHEQEHDKRSVRSMATGKSEQNSNSALAGGGNSYMKDVIASLHRATMASAMSGIVVRDAALVSLVNIVESENMEHLISDISGPHGKNHPGCQYSLIVLQVNIIVLCTMVVQPHMD